MNVAIREANGSDIDLLIEWRLRVLREVFSIPPELPLTKLEAENRRYYLEALPSGSHAACFAYAGREIAGCGGVCFSSELPSPDNPTGKCAYLMNVFTLPQFRKSGVGSATVRWLVQKAAEKNAAKIYLETTQAGRALYENNGFIPLDGMMILGKR